MRHLTRILVLLPLFFGGCTDGDGAKDDPPSLPVQRVMEGPDSIPLTTVVGLDLNVYGDVLVADSPSMLVFAVDSTGSTVVVLGGRGDGPGEFTNIRDAALSDRRQIAVVGGSPLRLTVWDPPYNAPIVLPLDGATAAVEYAGDSLWVAVRGLDFTPKDRSDDRIDLLFYDPNNAVLVPSWTVLGTDPLAQDALEILNPNFAINSDRSLALGRRFPDYSITVLPFPWTPELAYATNMTLRPVVYHNKKSREADIREVERRMGRRIPTPTGNVPFEDIPVRPRPPAGGFGFDERGVLWAVTAVTPQSYALDAYGSDGVIRESYRLPDNPWIIAVGGGLVAIVTHDGFDVPVLQMLHLPD